MFRRKPTGPLKAVHHADRLAALGSFLDEERFIFDGLSILTSGDGFVVIGFTPQMDGLQTVLGERTLEITKPMIDEAFARLQRE